jgi:hypothetical protein
MVRGSKRRKIVPKGARGVRRVNKRVSGEKYNAHKKEIIR